MVPVTEFDLVSNVNSAIGLDRTCPGGFGAFHGGVCYGNCITVINSQYSTHDHLGRYNSLMVG